MRIFRRTWLLAILAVAVPTIAEARCRFAYTDEIRRTVAAPEIAQREGVPRSGFFDDAKPTVTVRGDRVELLFSAGRRNLLDPPYFDMLLLDCGRMLGGSRLWWWPGTGVTGGWIAPDEQWPSDEWARSSPTRAAPAGR